MRTKALAFAMLMCFMAIAAQAQTKFCMSYADYKGNKLLVVSYHVTLGDLLDFQDYHHSK